MPLVASRLRGSFGLSTLINQGFELRPGQSTFDDVAPMFLIGAAGPDDESRVARMLCNLASERLAVMRTRLLLCTGLKG